MEYQLEIYLAEISGKDSCIKIFTSAAPFMPLGVGDLLNASGWDPMGSKLLRVLNVEHVIAENKASGINPSGKITHRALIHAERVIASPQLANEAHEVKSLD